MLGLQGTIYAANALLSITGNTHLNGALVVNTLNLSGNTSLTQMAAGSDGAGDILNIGNTLLAGNLNVYVNDPTAYFSADMRARIDDAIAGLDSLLLPYHVTVTEVNDPSLANMIVDAGTTSACGTTAQGVLGCFNPTNHEITILEGWNWYAGADPSQIGAGQYDFQTTITHEFGHALGLGGSSSLTSPMNETLPVGTTRRIMTVPDLNIPYPPEGADPIMAAGFEPSAAAVSFVVTSGATSADSSVAGAAASATSEATLGDAGWTVESRQTGMPFKSTRMFAPSPVQLAGRELAAQPLDPMARARAAHEEMFGQFISDTGAARIPRADKRESNGLIPVRSFAVWKTDELFAADHRPSGLASSASVRMGAAIERIVDQGSAGQDIALEALFTLWATGSILAENQEERSKKRQPSRK